ncbi:MAG: hypothetical protein AAF478_10195 [Pseudomonadota bacterium]
MPPKKKPNLAAALAEQEAPAQAPAQRTPVPGPSNDRQIKPAAKSPGREGQVNIASWHPMPVKFQLDELRLKLSRDRGKKVTLGQLQAEAYNDLFKKYGMAEIAQE